MKSVLIVLSCGKTSSFHPWQIYRGKLHPVFTAVQPYFHLGGRTATTCGKDEVWPHPDGSILSGGTVHDKNPVTTRSNFLF